MTTKIWQKMAEEHPPPQPCHALTQFGQIHIL